jgi:hypothetical protein
MKQEYNEQLASFGTEALFAGLTIFFLLAAIWRMRTVDLDAMGMILFILCAFFLFYTLNYRTLRIGLEVESLKLRFGIFTWTVALDNIETCALDDISLWRIGGAGIHFTSIRGRYRVMFNFLEYPRVVIALKRKMGPVRDVAFSTANPDKVMSVLMRRQPVMKP